jgi:hypothetical protein
MMPLHQHLEPHFDLGGGGGTFARRMCAICKETAFLTRVEVALSPYCLRIGLDQFLSVRPKTC